MFGGHVWSLMLGCCGTLAESLRMDRADELGIPFAVTVDFQTVKDGTATLRERDTTKPQIRVQVCGRTARCRPRNQERSLTAAGVARLASAAPKADRAARAGEQAGDGRGRVDVGAQVVPGAHGPGDVRPVSAGQKWETLLTATAGYVRRSAPPLPQDV